MRNKKLMHCYVGLTAFCLLFFKAGYGESLPPLTHSLTPVKAMVRANELRFHNLDEETVDIEDLKGKVVVVNFWATWCPPCRREMGSLEKLYQAGKDKNVEVVAVNVGEDIETVFSFLGSVEPSPSFQMLFDYDAESMAPWDVKALPTTYIVRPDGTIAYKAIGGREFDHPEILRKVLALNLK